jgi:hypothetical protein
VVRFKLGPCSLSVNLPVLVRCASAALRRVIRDLVLLGVAASIASMMSGAG